jgi:hypothetical protein
MTVTIKRGDAQVLHVNIKTPLYLYSSARLLLRNEDTGVVTEIDDIEIPTDEEETVVDVTLTPADTAEAGHYLVELECLPGPHTFPSEDFIRLHIQEDLG